MLTELPPKRRVKIPVRVSQEHSKVLKGIAKKIKETRSDILSGVTSNDKVYFIILFWRDFLLLIH